MARQQVGTAPSRTLDAARKADLRYDLSFFCVGKPGAGERLLDHVAVVAFTLPAGLTGSQAVATTAPATAASFSLNKNGTSVGTISFAAGATVGTFTASSAISIAIGDRLTLTAPSSQDANLSDLAFTLANTPAISAGAIAITGAVRYDLAQNLPLAQQLQGRLNLGTRGSGVSSKTAAYTIAAADAGQLIAANGTFALTLPAASAVGNGFAVEIANTGTGKITLTPNGSDTIRGAASLVVNQQESGVLVSDGTSWQVVGFAPVIIASSASNGAGYTRWSNGYCVQWGNFANSDATVAFLLAYSYTPAVVLAFIGVDTGNTVYTSNLSALSATGFTARSRYGNSGGFGGTSGGVNWRAEGYI